MKALIVGQAPSRQGTGDPFTGPSGRRLCKLMGVDDLEGLKQYFDLTNLLPDKAAKTGKGDYFPRDVARMQAKLLVTREDSAGRRLIIGCGHGVCRAFGFGHLDWFDLLDIGDSGRLRLLVFPHPSGVSQYWNDKNNVARAESWLRTCSAGHAF